MLSYRVSFGSELFVSSTYPSRAFSSAVLDRAISAASIAFFFLLVADGACSFALDADPARYYPLIFMDFFEICEVRWFRWKRPIWLFLGLPCSPSLLDSIVCTAI